MSKSGEMDSFVKELRRIQLDNVFNPYRDRCEKYDILDAPDIRSRALEKTLNFSKENGVDSLWVGRDLGYKGGRRTGLALTDEIHYKKHLQRFCADEVRPVRGEAISEKTASIIWEVLDQIENSVFLWNVFPFHPHAPGSQFSNRMHKATERKIGEEILNGLVAKLRPRRVVAIGNDAFQSAKRICSSNEVLKVRHPSYGGQKDFKCEIQRIYMLDL